MSAIETKSATAPAVMLLVGVILLFTPLSPVGAILAVFGGILLAVRLLAAAGKAATGKADGEA